MKKSLLIVLLSMISSLAVALSFWAQIGLIFDLPPETVGNLGGEEVQEEYEQAVEEEAEEALQALNNDEDFSEGLIYWNKTDANYITTSTYGKDDDGHSALFLPASTATTISKQIELPETQYVDLYEVAFFCSKRFWYHTFKKSEWKHNCS